MACCWIQVKPALLTIGLAGVLLSGGALPWLDVPFVRQNRDGCGAASIAMVMQYWSRVDHRLDASLADESRIYSKLFVAGRRGIAGRQLQGYLEENGFVARVFRGEVSDLRDHLGKGRPLVVCLAPRGSNAALHYVVVVGISESAVFFHDPVRGKLSEERLARFLTQWGSTDNWVLLATPHSAS